MIHNILKKIKPSTNQSFLANSPYKKSFGRKAHAIPLKCNSRDIHTTTHLGTAKNFLRTKF